MKKAITPIISIVVILFITIGLVAIAWVYLLGYTEMMTKSVYVNPGSSFCTGTEASVVIINPGQAVINNSDHRAMLGLFHSDPAAVGAWRFNDKDGGALVTDSSGLGNHGSFFDDKLILALNFDEGSGTSVNDITSYANKGTLMYNDTGTCTAANCPKWNHTDCQHGSCLEFNGNGSIVRFQPSDSLNITGDITISLWMYRDVPKTATLVHKGNHFSLGIGGWFLMWMDSSNWGDYANYGYHGYVLTGSWQHVAVTKEGSNVTMYQNGSAIFSQNFGGPLTNDDSLLHIGCYGGDSGSTDCSNSVFNNYDYNGSLDEILIYNSALTSKQIKDIYDAGRIKFAERVPGKFGYAMEFDGMDDYVNCGNDSSLALSDNITVAAWINALIPSAQLGGVGSYTKINNDSLGGGLDASDLFGHSVAGIGDLDGDGIIDLAAGSRGDNDGGNGAGAVWIMFMNTDGTVKSFAKINDTSLGGGLDANDQFGISVAGIGDLDGDGVRDIAAGANSDDDGKADAGAVWIMFMNTDGSVKSYAKINDVSIGGGLDANDLFGSDVAGIGDLDGDSVRDIASGALNDGDGAQWAGAVWILFMNTDGSVKSYAKINDTSLGGDLNWGDFLGGAVTGIGDLDGDGVMDIAAGAYGVDDGGNNAGSFWIILLNTDGSVKSYAKINDTSLGGVLDADDAFGIRITNIGDLDGDGVIDIAAGAYGDDEGGAETGAVWLTFMQDGFGSVANKQDSYQIRANDANARGVINGSSLLSAIAPPGWNHVALTLNSSIKSLYLNGFLAASGASGPINADIYELLMGRHFNGTLDEITIINRSLAPAEIQVQMTPVCSCGANVCRCADLTIVKTEGEGGFDPYFSTDVIGSRGSVVMTDYNCLSDRCSYRIMSPASGAEATAVCS